MSGREERERAVELYFSTSMSTKQVVEHLGYPTRQCPGTVAARRSQVCGCRPQAAHTVGDAVSRGGIVPVWYAAEAGGDGAWRQRRCGASLDETVPRRWNGGAGDRNGGMPCRRPEPIASRWAMTRMCCVGGYGSWSRGNALMREAVRGRKKDPGADLRRLSNREKAMPVDRLRPRYSLRSLTCLPRIAPSSYHYHHARLGVDKYAGLRACVARAFADSRGRYGYRRVKAALGTGVSEKVIRGIMREDGLVEYS